MKMEKGSFSLKLMLQYLPILIYILHSTKCCIMLWHCKCLQEVTMIYREICTKKNYKKCLTFIDYINNTNQNYILTCKLQGSKWFTGNPCNYYDGKDLQCVFSTKLEFSYSNFAGREWKYFAAIPLHCRIVFFLEKLKYQCYTFQALFQGYYFWI